MTKGKTVSCKSRRSGHPLAHEGTGDRNPQAYRRALKHAQQAV